MITVCRNGSTGKLIAGARGVAVLFFLIGLSGCGVKTDPLPPQQVVPKPITDLRYELSEKGVTLNWSYPDETVNGSDLEEIATFSLYRAVVSVDKYCDSCPIPFGQPIEIDGGVIPDSGRRTAQYESTLLRPGHVFFFKVRSGTGSWSQSNDSNIVSFTWYTPPKAPQGLVSQPGDSTISLSWNPVTHLIDEAGLDVPVKYQVYRSRGGGAFAPLGGLVAGTHFDDTKAVNGKKYFYKVQAVGIHGKSQVTGGKTEAVSAVSIDKTPPAPPIGVKAVKTAKGIKIIWEESKEKDVKGYRIYRRTAVGMKSQKIGEVNVPYTLFVDSKIPAGADQISYSVTSLDKAKPANESEGSREVTIRK